MHDMALFIMISLSCSFIADNVIRVKTIDIQLIDRFLVDGVFILTSGVTWREIVKTIRATDWSERSGITRTVSIASRQCNRPENIKSPSNVSQTSMPP